MSDDSLRVFFADLAQELRQRSDHLHSEKNYPAQNSIYMLAHRAKQLQADVRQYGAASPQVAQMRALYAWQKKFRCDPVALEHAHDAETVCREALHQGRRLHQL